MTLAATFLSFQHVAAELRLYCGADSLPAGDVPAVLAAQPCRRRLNTLFYGTRKRLWWCCWQLEM
jgi:hypothetical protein